MQHGVRKLKWCDPYLYEMQPEVKRVRILIVLVLINLNMRKRRHPERTDVTEEQSKGTPYWLYEGTYETKC